MAGPPTGAPPTSGGGGNPFASKGKGSGKGSGKGKSTSKKKAGKNPFARKVSGKR